MAESVIAYLLEVGEQVEGLLAVLATELGGDILTVANRLEDVAVLFKDLPAMVGTRWILWGSHADSPSPR